MLTLITSAQGQFRYRDKEYSDNYLDEQGRKQGTWVTHDINERLISKVNYQNNVPVHTVYFTLDNEELVLKTPDIKAEPKNIDEKEFPFYKKDIILKLADKDCKYIISHLIDTDGQIVEIRLIEGCNKKLDKQILKYFRGLEFQPAEFEDESIFSQWFYSFNIKMN